MFRQSLEGYGNEFAGLRPEGSGIAGQYADKFIPAHDGAHENHGVALHGRTVDRDLIALGEIGNDAPQRHCVLQQDPAEMSEIVELDRLEVQQRMAFAHDENEMILEYQLGLELAAFNSLVKHGEEKIEVASMDLGQ